MKRFLSLFLALTLLASLAAIPAFAEEEKVVNLFSWQGYVDDETLTNFEASTGIKVNFSYFSSNEEMLAKLEANGGSDYDVVLASDYVLNAMREDGLIQKLDKGLLTNYGNLKPSYLSKYFDPDNEYVIPYVGGTPLIVYDPSVVTVDIKSYNDLWDPALADSEVLIDDARNIIGITLKSLGYSMNDTDATHLQEASDKLMTLWPNVHNLNYDTPYADLINGEASIGYMFTPFVVMVLAERPDFKVVYPEEGTGFGIDGFVIPAKAPHTASAHAFLDYLMQGEVAAHTAEWQMYMTPNAAAEEFLSDDYKNSAAYITDEMAEKGEFIMNLGDEEHTFQEIWTEFKQQ